MDRTIRPNFDQNRTQGASIPTQKKLVLKRPYIPESDRDTKVFVDLPPSLYLVTGSTSKNFELDANEFIFSVGRGSKGIVTIEDPQLSPSQLILVKIKEECLFMDRGKRDLLKFDGIYTRQAFTPIESRLVIKLGKHWLVYEASSITSTDTVSINQKLATDLPQESLPGKIHLQHKDTKFQSSKSSCLIGTHQICDVRLRGESLAEFTAFVYWHKDGIFIEKMGVCRAPLCVNGNRVNQRTKIEQGDVISIGKEEIAVKFEGNVEARCKTLFKHITEKPEMAMTILSGADSDTHPLIPNNMYTVGRGTTSDIRVQAPSISRQHAKLMVRDKCFSIQDLESYNKTKVNMEEVDKATCFAGDIIEMGDVAFLAHYNVVRF